MDAAEKGVLAAYEPVQGSKSRYRAAAAVIGVLCCFTIVNRLEASRMTTFASLHHSRLCPSPLPSIGVSEFTERRNGLGRLLANDLPPAHSSESSSTTDQEVWGAYVTEPSPNSAYYLNVSTADWTLSERPWLAAVTPARLGNSTGAHLSVLAPSFELSRTQRLPFALERHDELSWITWEEADNPYDILLHHLDSLRKEAGKSGQWRLHLEENTRQFVAAGLNDAASKITGAQVSVGLATLKIREQRMRKTKAELALQHCAAKITVHALRMLQKRLRIGMTEKEGEKLITDALTAGGLTHLDAIVLFGGNAALPHASASATKYLARGEFALFDVGGNLGGYQSDFTRTMLPSLSSSSGSTWCRIMTWLVPLSWTTNAESGTHEDWPSERAREIWQTVLRAQEAALSALDNPDPSAASVDRAARDVIEAAGYGPYFTHRVGHGIGLQVHEHPYLNSGNVQVLLPRETFSNEPGIYIERSDTPLESGIGVRLEDMVVKTETGWDLISGESLAISPWSP